MSVQISLIINKQITFDLYSSVMASQKRMQVQNPSPLIIGYYPFRAKAQIVRLICQYLHVSYVDLLFTPEQWSQYRERQAKDWVIKDLPFLIDPDQKFSITGTASCLHYVIEKTGRTQLLGNSLQQMMKVDSIRSRHNIRHAILGLICMNRPSDQFQQKKNMSNYWIHKIEPILTDYQAECKLNDWYFGSLTIVDFFMYQLVNLIQNIFPTEIPKFKKLIALRNKIGAIKEIQQYEKSDRAVKQFCPVRYFSKFKQQKLKNIKFFGVQLYFKSGSCPLMSQFPNMQCKPKSNNRNN